MGGAPCWLPAEVEDEAVRVDGLRVRYLRGGSGPTLLLIHGLLGYSFSWRFNLAPLAGQFDVIAPDLPGYGFSEWREKMQGSMGSVAERLQTFLDALGVSDFHLLGTSHGGAVAVLLAARLKARLRRLVLVAPANPWSRHGRLMIPVFASAAGLHLVRRITGLTAAHAWGLKRMYGDRRRIAPGTVEGYAEPLLQKHTGEYVHAILRDWRCDMRQMEGALAEIADVPTLLLWGARDRVVFPDSAAEVRKRLRRSELVMMPGVGHLPYEEVPDEFNALVTRFLVQSEAV